MTDGHRSDCRFGPGYYRIELSDGGRRFCRTEAEVEAVRRLLPSGAMLRVKRDGYCLDPDQGDESTRGVMDGERFLNLPPSEAMAELGITSTADYARAYASIEAAVKARDIAVARGQDRASVVIKKRGTPVADALLE